MNLLAIFLSCFLVLRLLIALVNLAIGRGGGALVGGRKALSAERLAFSAEMGALSAEMGAKGEGPMVSVLIPARNEAGNIGALLSNLIQACPVRDPLTIEILIYDDLSEDDTAAIVDDLACMDGRIRLIRGKELPKGWLGKNHACHQLAKEASGRYFLFLDADVSIEEGLISATLGHLKKHRLALLSIFPQQIMHSIGERVTVPLMNWILVSLLPLVLTRMSAWSSFSAANGQFMLFDADIYRRHAFHQQVKGHKVEDIVIFRMMKQQGLPVQTLLSNGMIKCRMYAGFGEAVRGFSKNVFAFFGGSMFAGLMFALVTSLGFVPVWVAWGFMAAVVYLLLALLLRAVVSMASRQPVWQNMLLAPWQQMAFLVVMAVASYHTVFGKTSWKGRQID